MPFVSQAQAKWAFATKKPWARKWGHKTRLAGGVGSLPQYVARKNRKWGKPRVVKRKEVPSASPALGNANGPEGLFSAAGLEKKIRREHRPNLARRSRPQIVYKEGGHTGAMVALYLPQNEASTVSAAAASLFGDKAEKGEDLHITLGYLGEVDDLAGRLHIIVPIIQRYVQIWLEMVGIPLIATLKGYSAFPDAIDKGMVPIYRVVDSPLIMLWQDGLAKVLDFAGITTHRDHKVFTPHVTVAYSYLELVDLLPTAPAQPVNLQFECATLALGDLRIKMPLVPTVYKSLDGNGGITHKAEQIAPGVYRIRGNLCQVRGKFGPCDGATSAGFNKKPKGSGKGGKGGAGKKPALTDEEKKVKRQADAEVRKQEAEQQRVQNRTDALAALSKRPNDQAMTALDTLRQGGQPDQAILESMAPTGLVEKHADGSYTLSTSGRGLLNALDKGDPGAAMEAMAKGGDKIAADADRAKAKAERIAAHEQRIKERAEAKLTREEERKKRKAETEARRKDRENKKVKQPKSQSKPKPKPEQPPTPKTQVPAPTKGREAAPTTPTQQSGSGSGELPLKRR